jgi:hypothetical protein
MARNGAKTGGRPKGGLNKKTVEEIDRASRVLRLIETQYLEKDIKKLTPGQRMQLYADMMEYKVPKLSRTELKGGTKDELKITIVRSHNKSERAAPNAGKGAE